MPQKSGPPPPWTAVVGPCGVRTFRSQSGGTLALASVQVRMTPCTPNGAVGGSAAAMDGGGRTLRGQDVQIAVGEEVGVGVGTGARDALHAERTGGRWNAQRRVRVGVVGGHADALEIFAETEFDGRLPVA